MLFQPSEFWLWGPESNLEVWSSTCGFYYFSSPSTVGEPWSQVCPIMCSMKLKWFSFLKFIRSTVEAHGVCVLVCCVQVYTADFTLCIMLRLLTPAPKHCHYTAVPLHRLNLSRKKPTQTLLLVSRCLWARQLALVKHSYAVPTIYDWPPIYFVYF